MKRTIPSIFDLKNDDEGILRMPFNPVDYGEHNDDLRLCFECGEPYPQGMMKELGYEVDEGNERVYDDNHKWWPISIFFCEACWHKSDYSDAGNWTA